MKAFKCDRCGKFYDNNNEDYFKKENEHLRLLLIKDCHPYQEMKYDLCNECKKSLSEWLNTYKEE